MEKNVQQLDVTMVKFLRLAGAKNWTSKYEVHHGGIHHCGNYVMSEWLECGVCGTHVYILRSECRQCNPPSQSYIESLKENSCTGTKESNCSTCRW